jgi:DNA-binding LacI/PurR family transcriptional regulator
MPSVREIADLAGVSKSTVSLVLNDKPGVSDDMRQLVLDARRQLEAEESHRVQIPHKDRLPDLNRAQISAQEPLSIVVLHPPIVRSSHVFSEVLRGIQTAAQMYNMHLQLVPNASNASEQSVSQLFLTEASMRPNGVIAFGARQEEPLLDAACQLGIPCVVLGREPGKYAVSGVGRDESLYAYDLTRYLTDMGHQAIGFVGGQPVYDYWHTRLRGYQEALHDVGIDPCVGWVQQGDGETAVRDLLQQAPEVTAVIFINDTCAAQGLPLLHEAGYRIPDDLSVASFDDTDFARTYEPPITSVSYKRFEEGQWAVKILMDRINFPYLDRVQVIFTADLIERESCAPPRVAEHREANAQ